MSMCQRTVFSRSASRLAEEVQLRAEEEFMLEALKMIKQQRNCLQIERLHLESLKQQLMNSAISNNNTEQGSEPGPSTASKLTPSKPTELMSAVDMMTMRTKHKEHDAIDEDMQCNNQELNLNLSATATAFGTAKPTYNRYDYNSEDEGSSSDASNEDELMIDMNMFMHGTNDRD